MAFCCSWSLSLGTSKTWEGMEHMASEILWTMLPLWAAVLAGLILGWSWKPRWATLLVVALRSRPRLVWSIPPGFGARRLWLAAAAAYAAPTVRDLLSSLRAWFTELQTTWRLMQEKLKAFKPEVAAAFLPAGRLSERAQRILLQGIVHRSALPSSCSSTTASSLSPVSLLSEPELSSRKSAAATASAILASPVPSPVVLHAPVQTSENLCVEAASSSPAAPSVVSLLPPAFNLEQLPGSPSTAGTSPCGGCEAAECGHVEVVSDEDLEDLMRRLEQQEGTERGGQPWALLMEKRSGRMQYTAWRRDPQNGPTEYRSRTVVEDCTPETMRDFFWDDDFRPEWDGMLAEWRTLEECPGTGVQIVRWVRKFPLFCKDREYIIGRRIWAKGSTYYCITKGLAGHPDAPRRDKPRRVDQFYSSWRIQGLGNGSCEVCLFHQEDMGIQRDVAKMGVRQGMWGAVRKIEPGVRSFVKKGRGPAMSRSLSMARLATSFPDPCSPSAAAGTPGRRLHSLAEHRRARKWVSSNDLMRVRSSEELVEGEGEDGEVELEGEQREGGEQGQKAASLGQSREESAPGSGGRERDEEGSLPAAHPPHPNDSDMREGSVVMGVPSPLSQSSSPKESSSLATREASGGASGRRGEDLEATQEPRRRVGSRSLRLAVAATAVAVICGVETGLLVKLAFAAVARRAVCARRRRREGRLLSA